jgi:uncharacterized membrane protein
MKVLITRPTVCRTSALKRGLYTSMRTVQVRKVIGFVAGVGVVIGVAILFALSSGEHVRNSKTKGIQAVGDRVWNRVSSKSKVVRTSTGTEGV